MIYALCVAVLVLAVNCPASASEESARVEHWRKANPSWRGVHVNLQNHDQAVGLIESLPKLAAAGVNVVIAEVDYSFDFQSHPEVRGDRYVTKTEASDVTKTAHALGVRLIPQINCLGHQSWSKHTLSLLEKHPEFDETPGQYPENKDIYCRSWCPQNPDVNRFVFGLVDELVDSFQADAFHVGMDEVFIIGSEFCPRCKGGDRAKLFAKAVNDLHEHIVGQRKLEMLMWGDRLLDASKTGFSEWEASKNDTYGAVDLVSKDIILCDWHYEKRAEYPSVPFLLDKGFRVWPSGWQPLEASLAFSRFAKQQKNPRMLGYLCTTWGKVKVRDAASWPPLEQVLAEWK